MNPPPTPDAWCSCVVKQRQRRLIYGWGQTWCSYCKNPIKWGVAEFDPFQRTDGRSPDGMLL